jgi:transposase
LEKQEGAHPEAKVELWAFDEARLGLKPVIRRIWAPVGKRPLARFNRGYKWTYLYGFVCPQSGELYWLILPTVNVELFSMALQEFAIEVGAGEDKHILLVLDQAGWHTGREVELPEGIHLEFLPKGSPELQPAERLWPLTNEAIANRFFEEIEEIEQALVKRCVELLDQAESIRELTNYHLPLVGPGCMMSWEHFSRTPYHSSRPQLPFLGLSSSIRNDRVRFRP